MSDMTKTEWRQAMAAEITAVREEAGLSKRALARALDVPPTYVVQWEQGKGIGEDWVCLIEAALGLPAGELFQRAAAVVRPLVVAGNEASSPKGWFADSPSDQRVYGFPVRAGRTEWQAA